MSNHQLCKYILRVIITAIMNYLLQMKHVDVNEISNEKELPWQSAITPNSNEEGNEDDHYEKLFAVNYSDNSEDKSDVFVCPHCLHKYDGIFMMFS